MIIINMLKWFEQLLTLQFRQLHKYYDEGQINVAEYDAALSVIQGLQQAVNRKKQQSLSYKVKQFFRKAK